jgi:hypothetical protein
MGAFLLYIWVEIVDKFLPLVKRGKLIMVRSALTPTVLGRILILLLLGSLSACTQSTTGPDASPTQQSVQPQSAMRSEKDDSKKKKKDKKLVFKNKCSEDVSFDVTFSDGDDDSYSTTSKTTDEYSDVGTASAIVVSSLSLTSGSTTTVTLPSGRHVDVTWNDNVIVVVDTMFQN